MVEGIRRGRGAGDLVPAGRASSAARAHALAATYFRPRAVPSVQAIASAVRDYLGTAMGSMLVDRCGAVWAAYVAHAW